MAMRYRMSGLAIGAVQIEAVLLPLRPGEPTVVQPAEVVLRADADIVVVVELDAGSCGKHLPIVIVVGGTHLGLTQAFGDVDRVVVGVDIADQPLAVSATASLLLAQGNSATIFSYD